MKIKYHRNYQHKHRKLLENISIKRNKFMITYRHKKILNKICNNLQFINNKLT